MGSVKKITALLVGALLASLFAGGLFRAANYEWAEGTSTSDNWEWAKQSGNWEWADAGDNWEWAAPGSDSVSPRA